MADNLHDLPDKEIYDRLEKAALADRFLNSQEGKLIKEAADRIVERAVTKFALGGPKLAKDPVAIMELQMVIKKYKFGLFSEMDMLRKEGEYIFQEAKIRKLNLR